MPARARPAKAPTERRKAPRQRRSEATVEAIVEAAARILAADGPRALTTNAVARRAGVSVGSLYQYFPNKQAIVRALMERELARAARLRPEAIDDPRRPIADRMRAAIDWQFDVAAKDPALARALRLLVDEALPATLRAEVQRLRSERTRRTVASALLPPRDLAHVAFVVEVCLDALVDAGTTRRPAWIAAPAFRAEVAELLVRYLDESRPVETRAAQDFPARGR
jgi:AcrR family transcriptional regulator